MVQVPTATRVTVVVDTVHLSVVAEEKVIGFPEAPPVALTVKVPDPSTLLESEPKVIVWLDLLTVTVTEFDELAEL